MSKQSTQRRQQQHGPVLSPFSSATLKQVVRTVRTHASADDIAETNAAPKHTLPNEGPRARYRDACTTETLALLRTPWVRRDMRMHSCRRVNAQVKAHNRARDETKRIV